MSSLRSSRSRCARAEVGSCRHADRSVSIASASSRPVPAPSRRGCACLTRSDRDGRTRCATHEVSYLSRRTTRLREGLRTGGASSSPTWQRPSPRRIRRDLPRRGHARLARASAIVRAAVSHASQRPRAAAMHRAYGECLFRQINLRAPRGPPPCSCARGTGATSAAERPARARACRSAARRRRAASRG